MHEIEDMSERSLASIAGDAIMDMVEYDDSDMRMHDGPILGAPLFILHQSRNGEMERSERHSFKEKIHLALSPYKVIELELFDDGSNSLGNAFVYICPDMPPTAVHSRIAKDASERTGMCDASPGIVGYIEQRNLGITEELTDAQCEQILLAIADSSANLVPVASRQC